MRILHTADWHLGKRLDFYSRLEEQKAVLEEIIQIATAQQVDMVVIAGDLFDAFNPPNEATELLYKTLKKLAKGGKVPVIAIAGNHDAPDRVNVADVLARENGIIFIGRPTDEVPLLELENGFKIQKTEAGFIEIGLPQYPYPIRLLHTAFANEMRMKEYFGENKQESLQKSLSERWKMLAKRYCDQKGVNLLTTHLYLVKRGAEKPEEPEGEKPLNIGNADIVYSDALPEQIQYAALGHLHRYQDVGILRPAIYSSAPLAYSFAEAGQQKFISIIHAVPGEEVTIEKIRLTSGRSLQRKTFHQVGEAFQWLLENPEALVELTMVTDEFLKVEEQKKLYQAHNGIIRLIPMVKNATAHTGTGREIDLNQNIELLFKAYFKSRNNGQEPNATLMELFKEIKEL